MSGWMPIVIVLLAMALAIGPVLWLRPTDQDRQLASLRQRATRSGLSVQMQQLPPGAGEGSAAVYFERWRNPRHLQTGWTLELQRVAHDLNFQERWDWRNGRTAPEAALQPLRELLAGLPGDATAVISTDFGLGIQWRERSGGTGMDALEGALTSFCPVIEEAIRARKRGGGNAA